MAVTAAETAALLRRQTQARRSADRQRAIELRRVVSALVRAELPTGGRAWLIGTLAWGEFGARSDIDLVLDAVPNETATHIEIAVTRTARAEVDILWLDDLPAAFAARVLADGIPLHGD